eukprot:12582443-Ditylum_brightwellii.AAC.1
MGKMHALKQTSKSSADLWDAFSAAYDEELQNITQSYAEVEQEKEKYLKEYGDMNFDEETLLKINVGGKIITANRSILTQQEGSMLEALFSGRWEKRLQRDECGHIFLD